jgi:hypothetical protein
MSNLLHMIEPHAAAIESCADAMEADGIGGDPNNGHAVVLRKMAGDLRSDAARGRLSGSFHASAEAPRYGLSGALQACKDADLKVPAGNKFSRDDLDLALDKVFKNSLHPNALQLRVNLKNKIYAAGMVIEESQINEKQVLGAGRMLRKFGIPIPTHVHSLDSINAELDARPEISSADRVSIKQNLLMAGLMDAADGNIETPLTRPNTKMAYLILDQLGLDYPLPGLKLSRGALNAALSKASLSPTKRVEIKSNLAAAGFID